MWQWLLRRRGCLGICVTCRRLTAPRMNHGLGTLITLYLHLHHHHLHQLTPCACTRRLRAAVAGAAVRLTLMSMMTTMVPMEHETRTMNTNVAIPVSSCREYLGLRTAARSVAAKKRICTLGNLCPSHARTCASQKHVPLETTRARGRNKADSRARLRCRTSVTRPVAGAEAAARAGASGASSANTYDHGEACFCICMRLWLEEQRLAHQAKIQLDQPCDATSENI